MKIRWKFFWLLFVFALVPLIVVTGISQKATKKAGQALARSNRDALMDLSEKGLEITVKNAAEIQLRNEIAMEFRVVSMARKMEYLLARPAPQTPKALYWAPDYDAPGRGPEDLQPHEGYATKNQDGSLSPKPVSLGHAVLLAAPGVDAKSLPDDAARLAAMEKEFQTAFRECQGVQWFYAALESGLHASYPGHGGYGPGYDPRMRPWYKAAMEQTSESLPVAWTFPMVDAATGQVVFTASTVIRDPNGRACGVAGMDVLLKDVLDIADLPTAWFKTMTSFDVALAPNPDTGRTGALILAHEDYNTAQGAWTGMIPTQWLASEDPGAFERLLSRMERGEWGHARLPYRGRDSIWAFAPVGSEYFKLVVAPMSAINASIQEAEKVVSSLTRRHLMVNAAAALAALLLAILFAMFISKVFTGHIFIIVNAVQKLARGDFTAKIDRKIGDERDLIISAFNEMVPRLQESMRLRKALELAHEVQQNLLPTEVPRVRGLDMAGAIVYSDETGGDYYDYLEIDESNEHRITVVVGDVSGHGVPSALLMTTARALIRQRTSMKGSISSIVSDVNRLLTRDVEQSGRFMTLFYLSLDTLEKRVRWLRAGHDPALVYDTASGAFDELNGRGMFLGGLEDYHYEEYERDIRPGQVIVIGTDGIWESRNAQGEMFGKLAFRRLIAEHAHEPAQAIMDAVFQRVEQFRQPHGQEDDITLVIIKVLEC